MHFRKIRLIGGVGDGHARSGGLLGGGPGEGVGRALVSLENGDGIGQLGANPREI